MAAFQYMSQLGELLVISGSYTVSDPEATNVNHYTPILVIRS